MHPDNPTGSSVEREDRGWLTPAPLTCERELTGPAPNVRDDPRGFPYGFLLKRGSLLSGWTLSGRPEALGEPRPTAGSRHRTVNQLENDSFLLATTESGSGSTGGGPLGG